METITFNNKSYPAFQASGNAAQFALPYSNLLCKGRGYDIGCNRVEWSLPGSIPIDPLINPQFHASRLPEADKVDYIFSSHCLEHVTGDWYGVLHYWCSNIKPGGTLFLYLPDYSQEYWRPWNNRKHIHVFTPDVIKDAMVALGLTNIFVSGVDLNNSFMAIGEVV